MRRATCIIAGGAVALAAASAGAQGPARASAGADSFPTTRPTLGPPKVLHLPPAAERRLPNGLRLVVVEKHELPLADFALVVGTGTEADPAGREGLATMTAALLDEGTATRSSLQIADQAAYLGVSLHTGAGWDASEVVLHTPTAQMDSALALMADVTTRASFPTTELERLRTQRLTGLLQLRDRGPSIANRAFAQAVFGAGHPYGRPSDGTEASTRALTRDDVQRFYANAWRPDNATLVVVGDVTPEDVARRAERAFGAWRAPAGVTLAAPIAPAAPAPGAARVVLIDKPGAPQSSVRIGMPSASRATPDYFPLVVLNTVLGGSFTSRLNQNLRETHGYTYGAGSEFELRRAAGPFVSSAEVTGTKTDSALVEFMKELRAIGDTVPRAELEKAKRYLVLQMPGEFETTGGIAGGLIPVVTYGLPLDYYNSYAAKLQAVTQADVQRVARRYVDPAHLTIVVVGDRASVEPRLRALNLGPVEIRSAADVLGATAAAPGGAVGAGGPGTR
ncbi:MAG TPA: pitrilysin family protein [Gemmatirosa sp.]